MSYSTKKSFCTLIAIINCGKVELLKKNYAKIYERNIVVQCKNRDLSRFFKKENVFLQSPF